MFLSKIIKIFIFHRFYFDIETFCLLKKKKQINITKKHVEVYSFYYVICETKIKTSLLEVFFLT